MSAQQAEQVMVAQVSSTAALEGETAGPSYGPTQDVGAREGVAVSQSSQALQRGDESDGLAFREQQGATSVGAADVRVDLGAPFGADGGRPMEGTASAPMWHQGGDLGQFGARHIVEMEAVGGREAVSPAYPMQGHPLWSTSDAAAAQRATMQMEYSVSQGGSAVVRWVTRLTEFLRTTAATHGGFQGRFLEGLGISTASHVSSPNHAAAAMFSQHQQPQQQQQQQQQQQPLQGMRTPTRRPGQQALDFSPPEGLDQRSWRTTSPAPSLPPPPPPRQPRSDLFTEEQIQRMREMERQAPLRHRASGAPSSTSSEEIQAEMQRLLDSQLGEARELQGHVEALRRERDALTAQIAQGVRPRVESSGGQREGGHESAHQRLHAGDHLGGGGTSWGAGARHGDRASVQHEVRPGDRASVQHELRPGDRASAQHEVRPGDRASVQHEVRPGDRASVQHEVRPGDRASVQHELRPGDRASAQHEVRPGDRASVQHEVCPGDRASVQHEVRPGDRASVQHEVRPGDRASVQHEVRPGDRASVHYEVRPAW